MIIYLDLVIITNVIVDYAFLKTIAVVYQEKIRWSRLLLALLLGVVSLVLFIVPIPIIYNLRYIIGLFMGLIAYNTNKPQKRFLMIISFYIANIIFIGSLVIFKVKSIWLLLLVLSYVVLLIMIEKILKRNVKMKYEYLVKIKNKEYKAFLDTGNQSFYKGIPIVFVKIEFFNEEFIYIDGKIINTVNGNQELKIYSGPPLEVNGILYKVIYCFSQQLEYEIILNSSMGE